MSPTHPQVKPGAIFSFYCKNCKRSRSFGAAKLTMEQAATRHSREHVTHEVVLRVTVPYHVFAATDRMKPLSGIDGEPPF